MFVGIGVRDRTLDLAATEEAPTLPQGAPNNPEGVATVVAALQAASPRLIAIESTGSAFLPLLAWMVVSKLPVAAVAPAQIAAFRQQHGEFGNDSQLLARFAEVHHAELLPLALGDSERVQLQQVVEFRDLRVASQATARKWRHRAITEGINKIVELTGKELAHAEAQLSEVDAMIALLLHIQPESGS